MVLIYLVWSVGTRYILTLLLFQNQSLFLKESASFINTVVCMYRGQWPFVFLKSNFDVIEKPMSARACDMVWTQRPVLINCIRTSDKNLIFCYFYLQINFKCKPTFREANPRNYREVCISQCQICLYQWTVKTVWCLHWKCDESSLLQSTNAREICFHAPFVAYLLAITLSCGTKNVQADKRLNWRYLLFQRHLIRFLLCLLRFLPFSFYGTLHTIIFYYFPIFFSSYFYDIVQTSEYC